MKPSSGEPRFHGISHSNASGRGDSSILTQLLDDIFQALLHIDEAAFGPIQHHFAVNDPTKHQRH